MTNNKSVWNGELLVGLVSIPIKLTVGARAETVSFNRVCAEHKCGVKQPWTCEKGGERLDGNGVLKGYDIGGGNFITFDASELADFEADSSDKIEVLRFCAASEIDPLLFESNYYVLPDNKENIPSINDRYHLFRDELVKQEVVAVGKYRSHGREQVVIFRPIEPNGIAMQTLYYKDEVRFVEFPVPSKSRLPAEYRKVMGQLVSELTEKFNHAAYKDEYRASVTEAIGAKIAGTMRKKKVGSVKPAVPKDLMAQLKASLKKSA